MSSPIRSMLVIEDDHDVRELLLSHVRGSGWEVGGAADGATGLRQALLDQPAVVVVDILLPDFDGRAVIRALRAHDRTANCLVVLNSVLHQEDYLHTIVGLRIDAVLPKPFARRDVAQLLQVLEDKMAPERRPHAVDLKEEQA